ncbi:MAG: hypothetical protein CVU73_10975 [Deltaproteobacteria bacterium HGW-Deltaproteobacteria-8]|jgi:hypothetical protein|nr:MAG: hypothetical protein CVU73_10975 [Deltaproteobacteria bacterium HGW-Deltaproteobacteria-8]
MTESTYFDFTQAVKAKDAAQALLNSQLQPLRDQMDQLLLGPLATQITELEAKINAHCVSKADELRRLQGKDTGAASFVDGGFKVTVTLPKKDCGDDPAQYLKLTYGVDERRYKEWPDTIQAAFLPARTVTTGKPKIEIKEAK